MLPLHPTTNSTTCSTRLPARHSHICYLVWYSKGSKCLKYCHLLSPKTICSPASLPFVKAIHTQKKNLQMACGSERRESVFTQYVLLGYCRQRHWSKVAEMPECVELWHVPFACGKQCLPNHSYNPESQNHSSFTKYALHSVEHRGMYRGCVVFINCAVLLWEDMWAWYREHLLNNAVHDNEKNNRMDRNLKPGAITCIFISISYSLMLFMDSWINGLSRLHNNCKNGAFLAFSKPMVSQKWNGGQETRLGKCISSYYPEDNNTINWCMCV